ncbi:MAG: PhnD/SsuA/transferrin family substrate-binding protein [Gammaproteobacteria bacterium]|nr:PhnD/SsuA/transferrin family substrate-binding protein [Gammaproteobacteria bacterium]
METVLNRLPLYFLLLLTVVSTRLYADDQLVRIGVLSHRGVAATLRAWTPTADYLTQSVAGRRFNIVPLDFDEIEPAVGFGEVDFILVNPGIYVNLEVRYRVSRIATLNNRVGGTPYNVFGGVIFTHRDNSEIFALEDLKDKSFMAVDETSLGGFHMAWRELSAHDIDPYRDFSSLQFGGIHDEVVMAVKERRVDVGTVRTNILERMESDGTISLSDFKIIKAASHPEFFLASSTSLYPEWPFSKVQHTQNELAQQVAVALLNMPPGHPAADAGRYANWTIPLDYQPVHDLFKELKLPPYQELGKFTLFEAVQRYWYWLVVSVFILLFMILMMLWVLRLNQKLARSKLHLERQYELILNSVADGICGVDMHGNTTFVNWSMEQITGWEAEEVIGRDQHAFLHHTHADGSPHLADECPVYRTFHENEPRFVHDDVFWKKDRSSFPVEYSSTPIRDDNGNALGSVVVFRDISSRKQAEEDARQHRRELAHVARLSTMGEMASGIAHELNQPLTAITANSHACVRMLESGAAQPGKIPDVLERIASQAERAGKIIWQLRQFVRKDQPERSLADLNGLVRGVVVLLEPEAKDAAVDIRLELGADISQINVQHIQIEQVILNLARNAIEAMSEQAAKPRVLTLRTSNGGDNAVIVSVEDTGPGLDEDIVKDVFNPFITTKPKGMGLGLSISLGIVEAHQGNLYVDSAPGDGAVFRFVLPVTHGEE